MPTINGAFSMRVSRNSWHGFQGISPIQTFWVTWNVTSKLTIIIYSTEYKLKTLCSYENLKKHNELLTEEEIKEKLRDLEASYPDLLEYTDEEVEILEQKLEELKEIEELHGNLLENLK